VVVDFHIVIPTWENLDSFEFVLMRPRATAADGHSNLSLSLYCLHYISYLLPSHFKNAVLIINWFISFVKSCQFLNRFFFHHIGISRKKMSGKWPSFRKINSRVYSFYLLFFYILISSERKSKIFACEKIGIEY
jgi:hypothetical protein